MPVPLPATTVTEMPWPVRAYWPTNPVELASMTSVRLQPAEPPSELVMPATARAESSADAARPISVATSGSSVSIRSSAAASPLRPVGSGITEYGSSGTTRAMAIARSAMSANSVGFRPVVETMAERWPINTRRPRSRDSERSRCSMRPSRRCTLRSVPATYMASAASAPAARAAAIRSPSRPAGSLMRPAARRWRAAREHGRPAPSRPGSGGRGTAWSPPPRRQRCRPPRSGPPSRRWG